jgi:hypothetical protein
MTTTPAPTPTSAPASASASASASAPPSASASESAPTPENLPRVDSREAWLAALRWGFTRAMAGTTRRIVCVDTDFDEWPLNAAELHQELTVWLRRPQRQLVLLAAHFNHVPMRHPRFLSWRPAWAHAVLPFAAPAEWADTLPSLLLDDAGTLVQLLDPLQWRGRASTDLRSAHLAREQVEVLQQRAEPSFPVHTLGL